jgi:cell division transport system ATP-binding protein
MVTQRFFDCRKFNLESSDQKGLAVKYMVQFYNVSKVYPNGVKALDDVSLKIQRGEFVFLMGHSGAGKSTLVRMLIREELPTRGQVFVATRSLVRMKKKEVPLLRRSIGMVFQDFKLLERKTVAENIAFAMMVVGNSPREISSRVQEVLTQVGLKHKSDSFPTELSGGEQQRVGIARAIVNRPLLLIADEPTGNLDDNTSTEIMELLYDINRKGTTVIMATHATDLVRKANRRVVMLESGHIISDQGGGGSQL